MSIKVEFFNGKNVSTEWSGVYGYRPIDSDDVEFFSAIRLSSQSDMLSLDMIGKTLFEEMQNGFFDESNPEKDLVLRLESAAWKMKSKMDLILSREESAKEGIDMEMAVAVIYQNFLYIGVIGESRLFIKRGMEVVELSQSLEDGDMSGFLKTGSLELESSDRLFITTSKTALNATQNIELAIENLNINDLESSEIVGAAGILIADESDEWFVETSLSSDDDSADKVESLLAGDDELDNSGLKSEIEDDDIDPDMDLEYEEQDRPAVFDRLKTSVNSFAYNLKDRYSKYKESKGLDEFSDYVDNPEEDDESSERYTSYLKTEDDYKIEDSKSSDGLSSVFISTQTTFKKAFLKIKTFWNNKVYPKLTDPNSGVLVILKSIFVKLLEVLGKLYEFLKDSLFGSPNEDRRDFIKKGGVRSRNRKIAIGVVAILVILIFFGVKGAEESRLEQERILEIEKNIAELSNRYETLSSQISQAQSAGEERITSLLKDFSSLRSDINEQKKEGVDIAKLDDLANNISKNEDEILLVQPFTQPSILSDIGAIYPESQLSDMVYSNGSLFVSDSSRGVVYKVSASGLNVTPNQYVTGLKAPYILAKDAAGDIVFYDDDSTSSIGKFGHSDPTIARFGQLSPANIGRPRDAVIFEGNNSIYELKSTNRQIFKRDKSGDTYIGGGAATSTDANTNWRTDSDYSNGIDISVPYEVYVLISGQGVKRYFSRNENTITYATFNNFMQKDFDSLASASSMDVTSRYMGINDPVNKRVLFFQIEDNESKDITFIKQFAYRGSENIFSTMQEIVINEQDRSLFVLDGQKIIRLQF